MVFNFEAETSILRIRNRGASALIEFAPELSVATRDPTAHIERVHPMFKEEVQAGFGVNLRVEIGTDGAIYGSGRGTRTPDTRIMIPLL